MFVKEIIKRFRKNEGKASDLSLARVVMTSSQICAEVDAQVKRLTAIRRSLFECKCEEEDMLQGGLRAICGNAMNRSQTSKGAADTWADECDSVDSFRPLLITNAYSSTSPLLPSWIPITITARDVLEISNNAIRLKHRLAVPRSRDLKSRPFSGRLREVTIEATRNNRLRAVTIDQVKNTTGL